MSDTTTVLADARAALERYVEVQADPDGSLSFVHSDVPCAVQVVELAEGLVMLSMTCVLAWDLPAGPEVDGLVLSLGAQAQFGGLSLQPRGATADVTLRYAFPSAGLDPEPLGTLMMLVVAGASRASTELRAVG